MILTSFILFFSLGKGEKKKKKFKKVLFIFFLETVYFIICLQLEKRLDMLCLHENYFVLIDLVENVSVLHESSPKKYLNVLFPNTNSLNFIKSLGTYYIHSSQAVVKTNVLCVNRF